MNENNNLNEDNNVTFSMNGTVISSKKNPTLDVEPIETFTDEIEEDEIFDTEENIEDVDDTEEEVVEEEFVEKKRSSAVIDLEKKLLQTTWVTESELILRYVPTDDLTKNQQKLLNKCINKEEFTDKQFRELKQVLQKYRKILNELRPEDALKDIDDAIQMIQTEADFIEMMSAERNLLVQIDTPLGKRRMEFLVNPLKDSRLIDSLEMQVDLFRDFTIEEQTIYSKYSMGSELTAEEMRIYNKMNQEILQKQSSERIKTINMFLANQLTLKGTNTNLTERVRFWEVFPFNAKVGIFIKVQDMLGLSETKNSELFPVSQ